MPDVGVLQLSIEDNSTKAAGGLTKLSNALVKVSNNAANFNLGPVKSQIEGIVNAVKDNNTTVKNLGTLVNAIANFKKVEKINFNAQPFKDLKEAIGDGISLGQAGTQLKVLHEAFALDWSDTGATSTISSIAAGAAELKQNDAANTLKNVGTGLEKLAKGVKEIMAARETAMSGISSAVKENVGETQQEMTDLTKQFMDEREATGRSGLLPLNLQLHGGTSSTGSATGGDWRGTMMGIQGVNDAMSKIDASSVESIREIASALKEMDQMSGGSGLKGYADGLKEIASAIESGANSYRTLGRLATSITKVKDALNGFKIPNFGKLIELAQALQDNYNAETNLKKLAEAMEAMKTASSGFKMPSMKGIEKVVAAMNGTTSTGENTSASGFTPDMFQTVSSNIEEATTALAAFNGELGTTYSFFSQEGFADATNKFTEVFEMMDKLRSSHALGAGENGGVGSTTENMQDEFATMRENAIEAEGTVSEAYDVMSGYALGAGDAFTEAGSAMNAIIPYGKNLEDSWEHLNKIAQEAKKAWLDAHPGWGTGRIDPLVTASNTMGRSLRGENGKYLQDAAIEKVHRGTGLSEGEIRKQIDEIGERAARAREQIQEIVDTLNTPIDINWAQSIDRMFGIGGKKLTAEDWGVDAFANEATQRINEIFNMLENPPKLNLAEITNGMTGVNTPRMTAEEWGVGAFVTEASQQIAALMDRLNTPINYSGLNEYIDRMQGINQEAKSAEDSMRAFLEAMDGNSEQSQKLRELNPEMEEFKQKMDDAGVSAKDFTGKLVDVDGELKSKKKDTAEATKGFEGFKESFESLKKSVKSSPLGKLGQQFVNIAKRMAIRAIIKSVTGAFSEGVENVYRYSKAIGSSFSTNMDNAASTMLQFKNSIGAAVSPLISSLIPTFQTIVNWLIEMVNYVNQFISLLSGQSSWTKAVYTQTDAYEDNAKSAKKASSSTQDLLADWDELNIIQSNSGSSSGSSSNDTDYTKMFTEVSEYASEVRTIVSEINTLVEGIKTQFGSIWNFAKRVGVAMLAWSLSSSTIGIISTLAGLVAGALTLDLVFNLTSVFDRSFLQTGNYGWLIAGVLTTAIGSVLMKKILGSVLGGKFARLAIPLTLAVSAFADIVTLLGSNDVSALSPEALALSAKGALSVGAAAAYLAVKTGATSFGSALAGGAALAAVTFGVFVGLKATKDVIDTGDITAETIQADLLAAGAIGGGLAILAVASGVGLAGTLALAAGGAVVTFGVLVGLQLLSSAFVPGAISWGDFEATEEQIRAFVSNSANGIFTVNPNTILSIVDPKIEVVSTEEGGLKTTVNNVQMIATKISLGISNTNEVLDDLKEQIFGSEENGTTGLIGQFKSTAKAHQSLIETSIMLVPTVGSNDDGTQKDLIDRSSDAWTMLTGHMDDLGAELAQHMAEAYKEDITEEAKSMELKTISELTMMMANVSAAITKGEQYELAMQGLEENLNNLSEGSWNKMFEYIEQYKKDVTDAYAKTYDEGTVSLSGQVAGLEQSMNDELRLAEEALTEADRERHLANAKAYESEYNYWKEQLELRRAGRDDAIEAATKNAMNDETIARIRKILTSKIDKSAIESDDVAGLDLAEDAYTMLFKSDGTKTEFAEREFTNWLNSLIEAAFKKEDADTIKNAIQSGLLGYGDVIDKTVIDEIAETIGITDNENSEIKDAWDKLMQELFKTGDKDIKAPGLDTSSLDGSTKDAESKVDTMVANIKDKISSMDGLGFTFSSSIGDTVGGYFKSVLPVQKKATGGFVKSGDLVMANENGQFEMMGKMGNQPVVANNQQIVNGITQGVATANGDVVSELRSLASDVRKILNKEFTVKYTANSTAGRYNQLSADAYSKVTG